MCASNVIFKALPKLNNRPIGEKSPNLVTPLGCEAAARELEQILR
jgi:hypothetical protein